MSLVNQTDTGRLGPFSPLKTKLAPNLNPLCGDLRSDIVCWNGFEAQDTGPQARATLAQLLKTAMKITAAMLRAPTQIETLMKPAKVFSCSVTFIDPCL